MSAHRLVPLPCQDSSRCAVCGEVFTQQQVSSWEYGPAPVCKAVEPFADADLDARLAVVRSAAARRDRLVAEARGQFVQARRQAEDEFAVAVLRALDQGVSGAAVGRATGLSRQRVHQLAGVARLASFRGRRQG